MESYSMDSFTKYLCYDVVISSALMYITLRFIPGPGAIAAMIPIPGFANATTVGESVVNTVLIGLISKKVSGYLCKGEATM